MIKICYTRDIFKVVDLYWLLIFLEVFEEDKCP